jgi:hypothetical protein
MSRSGFQKSVRMFHKFSEETMRRHGGNQAGREGVAALAAIDAVLKAERLFDGSLLEPLAAFTNLLQSSQLPPEFGDYSLADALLAIEDAHAELRQNDEQRWEFEPEVPADAAATLEIFTPKQAAAGPSGSEHATKLRRFVLEAAEQAAPGAVLVVGALAAPELPLAELAARCQRLTLSDLDLGRLEELTRRVIPEQHRERVKLERYDVTGSYVAFAAGVETATGSAADEAAAEQALLAFISSYDVGAGSAGLSIIEEKPDLAVSAMLLTELGGGYGPYIAAALERRGFSSARASAGPLTQALTLLRCLVAQHHIHALVRRAKSAALISAVSQVELPAANSKQGAGAGPRPDATPEPHDLLEVERLVERLPQIAEVKTEQSWEWRQDPPPGAEKRSLLTLVEALLV